MKVAFLLSSRFGQVKKIAAVIADRLQAAGNCETVYFNLDTVAEWVFADYDLIIFGASVRYGHLHRNLRLFTRCHKDCLNAKNTALFTVSLVARDPAKSTPDTNVYTRKFLHSSPFKPKLSAVFAGALEYRRYGFWDRHIIRLIMRLTDGETDLKTGTEYTDWEEVRTFADALGYLLPLH